MNFNEFYKSKEISSNDVDDACETFRNDPNHSDGWFMQGGCYDYAIDLGSLLEDCDINVDYYEYGSNAERLVHVAIGVKFDSGTKYIDFNNFSNRLEELSENGDFYTDTQCSWSKIDKSKIPGHGDRGIVYDEFKTLLKV